MTAWMQMTDELGPEKIMYVYDAVTGMKGVVVVDTLSLAGAAGGTRMLADITTEEIVRLARAMTYKFAILDLPIGGAKAGIWAEQEIRGLQRKELLVSFGNAVKALLASEITLGPDMGTDMDDVATFYQGAGVQQRFSGLSLQMIDGEPLEDHAPGYGVVVAALAACQLVKLDIKGAKVAIEGFGKVGGGVARYFSESGARVVAISTRHGTAYNKDGLDIPALLQARKTSGDKAVAEYKHAKHSKPQDLYTLPVDILVPGARPYVINKKNAGSIKAMVISSMANIPITMEAEEILFQKRIVSVPDFISNAGGIILAVIDMLGGTSDNVFTVLRNYLGPLTTQILNEAKQQNINPRSLAVKKCREKILAARKQPVTVASYEELMSDIKKRLGL
ncbi:MAG: hypothetical protein NT082_07320 [Chloroflexi bacterium]|nr:hypothetical protein [Chloroflexota bacterium]